MGKRKSKADYRSKKRRYWGSKGGADAQVPAVPADDDLDFDSIDDTPSDSSFRKMHEFAFCSEAASDSEDAADADSPEEETEDICAESCGNRIVNFLALANLIHSSVICRACKQGSVVASEVARKGLSPVLQLSCDHCGSTTSSTLAKVQTHGGSRFCDINRKAVLAMRLIGCGLEALKTVCAVMDMPPPMSRNMFAGHRRALHSAAKETAGASMTKAASDVLKKRDAEETPTDGTWMRRGHSSLYGVQTVISHDTSQILDVEVLSKNCPECTSWKARRRASKVTDEQFTAWQQSHTCRVTTQASAPGIEANAVVTLWQRSEAKHKLRYTTYIGDGDSKGHKRVTEANPYGDVAVVKDECIGHVQKRVGKGLRDLKAKLRSEKLSDGKPLCGKGRLTEKYMDKLQNYYGRAIRNNIGDLKLTYKAIWASLYHSASTDERPRHMFCPTGKESWCKWQQREAGVHVIVEPRNSLPQAVVEVLKPLYVRLTETALLQRCSRGATQNANESFNGSLWRLCPKETFCGPATVETATFLATGLFNHGAATIRAVMQSMHCDVGTFVNSGLEILDTQRLYHSAKKSKAQQKKARKHRRAVRKGLVDAVVEKEGVVYDAGAF